MVVGLVTALALGLAGWPVGGGLATQAAAQTRAHVSYTELFDPPLPDPDLTVGLDGRSWRKPGLVRAIPAGDVVIGVTRKVEDDTLWIRVRNPSLPPDAPDAPGVHGAGHAHRSIAHRLGYAFGPRARMACGWDGGYYACELELPLATGRRTP